MLPYGARDCFELIGLATRSRRCTAGRRHPLFPQANGSSRFHDAGGDSPHYSGGSQPLNGGIVSVKAVASVGRKLRYLTVLELVVLGTEHSEWPQLQRTSGFLASPSQ